MQVTRRTVLKGVAAAGVGVTAVPAPEAEAAPKAVVHEHVTRNGVCSCAVWGAAPTPAASAAALQKCGAPAATPRLSASFAPASRDGEGRR